MRKITAVFLVLAIILSVLCGCAPQKNDSESLNNEPNGAQIEESAVEQPSKSAEESLQPDENAVSATSRLANGLTVEHITTVLGGVHITDQKTTDGGLIYKDENDLWGIVSPDGASVVEPKYVYCVGIETDFQVATQSIDPENVRSYNRYGVVNAAGEELVPMKYAYLRALNERYYYVAEVTGLTENREEALLYGTDFLFEAYGVDSVKEDDILLKGNWYVYDVVARKPMEGITGTKPYAVNAYGDVLQYFTDAEEQVRVNQDGEKLPENIVLFRNGCYALKSDTESVVYDADGEILFTLRNDDLTLKSYSGDVWPVVEGYIVAKDQNGQEVLLDMQGTCVSAMFDNIYDVYGELINTGDTLSDFSGNVVYEGDISQVYFEKQWSEVWIVRENTALTMIDRNGTVLYQGDGLNESYFYASTKEGDQTLFYCLEDKDFTIKALGRVAPWLAFTETEKVHYVDLVDMISGRTLLSDKKNGFMAVEIPGSVIYIYTFNENDELEIYAVK